MNERIKKLRKALDLTQQDFADKLGTTRNNIAGYEIGRRTPSVAVISLICREFNVSEKWLRTGEGEMFVPSPDGTLEVLAREYELSPGMYILIKRLLALKPENQQAAVEFAVKLAEDLNKLSADYAAPPAAGQERTQPDTSGQKGTEVDLAAKVAELERQNQELAAKVAAMEEEDALLGLTDVSSKSPSVSVGNFSPAPKAKK